MALTEKIGFIGAGKMGEALINAIIEKGISSPGYISASDKKAERLEFLEKEAGINTYSDNIDIVKNVNILFLAAKPQDFKTILSEIKDYVTPEKLIISIAAGIKTSYIEEILEDVCLQKKYSI